MLKTMCSGELSRLFPIIDERGANSAMFDNCLEFLTLCGRSLPHAVMMMIPEPWAQHEGMSRRKRAFYQYHSFLMEPWDGPAAVGFTDGTVVGAVLDRNGLRPARYYVTEDDLVILSSEVGVLEVPGHVVRRGGWNRGGCCWWIPGQGRIISDEKRRKRSPPRSPLSTDRETPHRAERCPQSPRRLSRKRICRSGRRRLGTPMRNCADAEAHGSGGPDPVASMGVDTPWRFERAPQLLYEYFKQLFRPGDQSAHRHHPGEHCDVYRVIDR